MNRFTKAAVLGLVMATAAPLIAEAQSRENRREYRQDRYANRQDFRQERFNDRRDYRNGQYAARGAYRQDYRYGQGWNNNQYWWRGRPDFHDYRGVRAGYWYAPSYGYYPVAPRYYNQYWVRGAYLPPAYRSYYVHDPYVYGLAPAPYGYRYVHAGNDIVMIALATGLIASVLYGAY